MSRGLTSRLRVATLAAEGASAKIRSACKPESAIPPAGTLSELGSTHITVVYPNLESKDDVKSTGKRLSSHLYDFDH